MVKPRRPSARVVSIWIVVAALAGVPEPLVAAGGAGDDVPALTGAETEALRGRLDELRRTVDALEAAEADRGRARRSEYVRGLVADVLADADTRASLLSDEATGGWDRGFFIASPDRDFLLEISGQVQVRFLHNRQKNAPQGARDDSLSGFEIRRTKWTFDGNIGIVEYRVSLAFDDEDGRTEVQGPYLQVPLGENAKLRLGRFRVPLGREEGISSRRQLAVERSLVTRRFFQSRAFGASIDWRNDWLRIRTGFLDATRDDPLDDSRWRVATRVELLLSGRWKELRDFTSFPDDDPVVMLGGGYLVEVRDRLDLGPGDLTNQRWAADLTVELGGVSIFGGLIGNRDDPEVGSPLDQVGVVAQAGVFLTDELETFARYEWGDADTIPFELNVVTAGLNVYLDGNDLKFSADVGYGFEPVAGFWDSSGAGWRRDRDGTNGQVVVRGQFQLLF